MTLTATERNMRQTEARAFRERLATDRRLEMAYIRWLYRPLPDRPKACLDLPVKHWTAEWVRSALERGDVLDITRIPEPDRFHFPDRPELFLILSFGGDILCRRSKCGRFCRLEPMKPETCEETP